MNVSVEHAVSASVDNWLANIARKSVYFDELMSVLFDHFHDKGVDVYYNVGGMNYVSWQGVDQFKSVSFAACVEFALKFEPPAAP